MPYSNINSSMSLTLQNRANSSNTDANKTECKLQNAIFCKNCSSNLCEPCQQVLTVLAQRNEECSQLYDISAFQVAIRRMPALLLTMVFELIGKECPSEVNFAWFVWWVFRLPDQLASIKRRRLLVVFWPACQNHPLCYKMTQVQLSLTSSNWW